ncbi:MAG: OmpH family outer membrane protein [Pirellulales bacterium]
MRTLLSRKRSQFVSAIVASVSISGFLCAQSPHPLGANAPKYKIAVVDINAIFNRHARLKAAMEEMKKEMQTADAEIKGDREKIAQLEQQRNTYNVGSEEYKRLDEQMARMLADLQLKMGKLQKEFAERRARTVYQSYLEVVEAVNYYAKRQNIGLVLRFNGESADPNRPDEMMREIGKDVVMQDQIDITGDVLLLLNRDQQQAARPAQPASQLPPR